MMRREQMDYLREFIEDERMNEQLIPNQVLRSRAGFQSLDKASSLNLAKQKNILNEQI